LYDLALVEHGPLPPHERSWRHPSELGPTRADVDTGPNHHLAAFAIGTVAVLAVVTLVVAMTPRPASGPLALSATTTPISASARTVSVPTATPAGVAVPRIPVAALLTSFAAFPHAVTSGPQLTLDGTDIADELPDDADMVFVRTEAVTYELRWDQVPAMSAPDGTVVFDTDGDLLAHVARGELVTLVDD
jgi:hypothetical protein